MATSYEATEAARVDFETLYVPRIRTELIRQGEAAAAHYEAGSSPEMAAALVKPDGLLLVLNELYAVVGASFAKAEYDTLTVGEKALQVKKLPGADLITGWVGRLRRFFGGEGSQRARGIQESTQDVVKRVLTKAREDGLSIPQAAAALRAEIETLSQARAVVIARTEIVAASNLGSLLGAEATGLRLNKLWIATPGPRTRDSHRRANGQSVVLQSVFTVGGVPMRYPGDPLGPAREVVQCRCSIGYAPI